MGYMSYELNQAWGNLDEAADYFRQVAWDLEKMKAFKCPPTDLFLDIATAKSDPFDKTIFIKDV